MPRQEFTKAVYAQIVHRATNADGMPVCEGCGLVLGRKPYHVDHTIPTALRDQHVKPKKLTKEDGKLLGLECCHGEKTAKIDVPQIAKAKRQEQANNGWKRQSKKAARPIQSQGFTKGKTKKALWMT